MKQNRFKTTWDSRFSVSEYVYGTEPNDFLRSVADFLPKKGKILSLAEGEGRNAVFLATQGYDVIGIDNSEIGLEKAQKLAKSKNVRIETIYADIFDFNFGEESWDGIVSIFCQLPTPKRAEILKKCVKSLKPNGVFVMEAYTPRQLVFKTGGPPKIEYLYEPREIKEELEGLRFDIVHEIKREINEGKLHHGRSAVLQVVARKAF